MLSGGMVNLTNGTEGSRFSFMVDLQVPEEGSEPTVQVNIGTLGGFTMDDEDGDRTYHFNTTLSWGARNFSFSATNRFGARAVGDTGNHELYVNARPVARIRHIAPSPAKEGITVLFKGDGSDKDGTIEAYQWSSSIDLVLGQTATLNLEGLSAGEHTIRFQVKDDRGVWSLPTETRLIIEKGEVEPREPGEPGEPGEPIITPSEVVMVGVASTTLTVLGLALGLLGYGETFRYRYWALLAPLMVGHGTQRRPSDPLANEIRGLIRGYLLAHPGSHYCLLKEELGLVNGTLAYHLKILEREGLVTSERDGRMRHFFAIGKGIPACGHGGKAVRPRFSRWTGGGWGRDPKGHPPKENRSRPRSKPPKAKKNRNARPVTREKLLVMVEEHPGLSQTDLAEAFGVTSAAVKYHIDRLIGDERLRRERRGLKVEYFRVKQVEEEDGGSLSAKEDAGPGIDENVGPVTKED